MKRYRTAWIAAMFVLACGGKVDSGDLTGWPGKLMRTHSSAADPFAFTTVDAPGMSSTRATGINDSGQMVLTAYSGGRAHAFLLVAGVFTNIDIPVYAACYPSPCPRMQRRRTATTAWPTTGTSRARTRTSSSSGRSSACGAFGGLIAPETSTPPYGGTHTLVTDLPPQPGTLAHGVPSNDANMPLLPDGTPVLRDAWRYMLTADGEDDDHEKDE